MLDPRLALDLADTAKNIRSSHAIGEHDGFAGHQIRREPNDGALLQNDDSLGVLVHGRQVLAQALRGSGRMYGDGNLSANCVAADRFCHAAS
jgi:hypothetical protein